MEILNIENNLYPEMLRKIKNPPKKLFVCGNKMALNSNCISVVGSRTNTKYGESGVKSLLKNLLIMV